MAKLDYREFYRRNLPHFQPAGGTFFVTFRLAGSIPRAVLVRWRVEQAASLRRAKSRETDGEKTQAGSVHHVDEQNTLQTQASSGRHVQQPETKTQAGNVLRQSGETEKTQAGSVRHVDERNTLQTQAGSVRYIEEQRRRFSQIERYLDKAETGPLWLKDERVAEMVADSLRYRDGKVYRLDAFCVMPNHVHVVFAPLPVVAHGASLRPGETDKPRGVAHAASLRSDDAERTEEPQAGSVRYVDRSLASILHSLKSFTSNQANKLLQRSGQFWEHENFDHCVRDEEEWARVIAYVLNNPVKARLVDDWRTWRWTYSRFA